METFPKLLQLPYVAFKEVLKTMSPIELFLLSQCSDDMTKMIPKQCPETEKYTLATDFNIKQIKFNESHKLDAARPEDEPRFQIKIDNEYMMPVRYSEDNESLKCFFGQDQPDGMMKLALHLSKFFKCPINRYTADRLSTSTKNREMIATVMGKQNGTIQNLILHFNSTTEDLKWILENVKVPNALDINVYVGNNFGPDRWPQCDELNLSGAFHVSMDQLLSFTWCRSIHLMSMMPRFTHEQLDEFLKKWKAGALPKLEYFMHFSMGHDPNPILGFTRAQMAVPRAVRRDKITNFGSFPWLACLNGVDFERDDGTKAGLQIVENIGVTVFQLFVWDDLSSSNPEMWRMSS